MASKKYSIINRTMKCVHINKLLNKDGEKLDKLVRFFEKIQTAKIPEKKLKGKCDYRIISIQGSPCVIAGKSGSKPERAVMLFFGGAYFMPPDGGDYSQIAEICNLTNSEVWFLLPPMAPAHKMSVTMDCIMEAYQELLKHFSADKIVLYGNSSGAATCLYVCLYIRKLQLGLPYPEHLIMVSPGMTMPPTKEQQEKMRLLENTDYLIPLKFCTDIGRILFDEQSSFLADPFTLDWKGFPDMDIFYGTHELFYAYSTDIEKACNAGNVRHQMHYGEGMMHCWTQLSMTREGRSGRQEIYGIIRSV